MISCVAVKKKNSDEAISSRWEKHQGFETVSCSRKSSQIMWYEYRMRGGYCRRQLKIRLTADFEQHFIFCLGF